MSMTRVRPCSIRIPWVAPDQYIVEVRKASDSLKRTVSQWTREPKARSQGLDQLLEIAEQLIMAVIDFETKAAPHSWDKTMIQCSGCSYRSLASVVDIAVRTTILQARYDMHEGLLPIVRDLVDSVRWRECALDPEFTYRTSSCDQRTSTGDLTIDHFISEMPSSCPEPDNEGKSCETCEDCQKMFRSFIDASFPYLGYKWEFNEFKEKSRNLLRVCRAASMVDQWSSGHHIKGGGLSVSAICHD